MGLNLKAGEKAALGRLNTVWNRLEAPERLKDWACMVKVSRRAIKIGEKAAQWEARRGLKRPPLPNSEGNCGLALVKRMGALASNHLQF